MRKLVVYTASAVLVLAGFSLMGAGEGWSVDSEASRAASDARVCYRTDKDDYEKDYVRIVLNVKRHSDLSFPGGFKQTTYTVVGKHVDSLDGRSWRMAVAAGGVIVTDKKGGYGGSYGYDFGAHLGLEANWVRSTLGPLNFDCSTDEESSTPQYWYCSVRGDGSSFKDGKVRLMRLDYPDERCGFFQDKGRSRP